MGWAIQNWKVSEPSLTTSAASMALRPAGCVRTGAEINSHGLVVSVLMNSAQYKTVLYKDSEVLEVNALLVKDGEKVGRRNLALYG